MDRKALETLADKYQAKADQAYQNYQETGISRYDNESCWKSSNSRKTK